MTIKSLDYQVIIPKAQEVAKQLNNQRQHDPINQQLLAEKAQKQQSHERGKINNLLKTEHKKIKGQQKEKKEQHKGKPSSKRQEEKLNKVKTKNSSVGKNIDLKI